MTKLHNNILSRHIYFRFIQSYENTIMKLGLATTTSHPSNTNKK